MRIFYVHKGIQAILGISALYVLLSLPKLCTLIEEQPIEYDTCPPDPRPQSWALVRWVFVKISFGNTADPSEYKSTDAPESTNKLQSSREIEVSKNGQHTLDIENTSPSGIPYKSSAGNMQELKETVVTSEKPKLQNVTAEDSDDSHVRVKRSIFNDMEKAAAEKMKAQNKEEEEKNAITDKNSKTKAPEQEDQIGKVTEKKEDVEEKKEDVGEKKQEEEKKEHTEKIDQKTVEAEADVPVEKVVKTVTHGPGNTATKEHKLLDEDNSSGEAVDAAEKDDDADKENESQKVAESEGSGEENKEQEKGQGRDGNSVLGMNVVGKVVGQMEKLVPQPVKYKCSTVFKWSKTLCIHLHAVDLFGYGEPGLKDKTDITLPVIFIAVGLLCLVLHGGYVYSMVYHPSQCTQMINNAFLIVVWAVAGVILVLQRMAWPDVWSHLDNFHPEYPCQWMCVEIICLILVISFILEVFFHPRMFNNLTVQKSEGVYSMVEPMASQISTYRSFADDFDSV